MTYQFRPAVREQCFTLTGFAGPSGSGKTYSALRFATGLAQGRPIAMVDTEARRGLHYADQFDYLYSELEAPFSPSRYLEAIKAAEAAGAFVTIVDSMSHEHEGPGGVLEMHETELDRMAGEDFRKREACKFAAWIKPKQEHNRFVNSILQVKMHLIFCFRAKEKMKLVKNDKGRMEPQLLGWQPICTDRLEYEMTALLMLPPNSRGVPDLSEGATKMQEQHAGFFRNMKEVNEESGKALADWASGGAAPSARTESGSDLEALLPQAEAAADKGMDALQAYWKALSKPDQATLAPKKDELKMRAARAADSGEAPQEDPEEAATEEPEGEPADEEDDEIRKNLEKHIQMVRGKGRSNDVKALQSEFGEYLKANEREDLLREWNGACLERLRDIGRR